MTFPHHVDAERAILGSILVDNDTADVAHVAGLTADDFYQDAHQRIYRAIVTLVARKSALDMVTLVAELRRVDDLDIVDAAYLATLISEGVRSTNLAHYIALVQSTASRRAIMRHAQHLIDDASERDDDASIIDQGIAGLLRISQTRTVAHLVEGFASASQSTAFLETLHARRAHRLTAGCATGFSELDRMTDGFHPGQLIVLAARPSQGKSAIALQFALASESCAFFSLEMTRMDLVVRALAVLGRLNGWDLRRGQLAASDAVHVSRAQEMLADSGLAIDDSASLTVAQLRAKARRRQALHGLSLIVVDYVQLMKAAGAGRRDVTREQEVASIARGLKEIAKDLDVPVLALAQLNRATEQGREKVPTLANLRESGALEQDADVVLFVHRTDAATVASDGPAKLIIAKHRAGPTGVIDLHWIPTQTRFTDSVEVA